MKYETWERKVRRKITKDYGLSLSDDELVHGELRKVHAEGISVKQATLLFRMSDHLSR